MLGGDTSRGTAGHYALMKAGSPCSSAVWCQILESWSELSTAAAGSDGEME